MPAAWVAAIGSIAGAASNASAADKASGAQVGSSKEAIAAQQGQYAQTRSDNAQYLKTGTSANVRLAQLLGQSGQVDPSDPKFSAIYDAKVAAFDANHKAQYNGRSIWDASADASRRQQILDDLKKQSTQEYIAQYGDPGLQSQDSGSLLRKFSAADLEADPVYQSGLKFGLDQGTGGINARALATGNYDSGATLKALTRYGADYGSTKANESYNRYNQDQTNIFNKLSGISGTGQVSTAQVGAAGTNAANQIGADLLGAGNARAAGIVGNANAWGGAATGVANAYQTYDNNQTYKKLIASNNNQNYTSDGTYKPTYSGYSGDGSYAYG